MARYEAYSYWSLFSLYEKCPYSFKIGAEDWPSIKPTPPPSKYLTKQLLGAAFHMAMEWLVKKPTLTWEHLPKLVDYWVEQSLKQINNPNISVRRANGVKKELLKVLEETAVGPHRPVLDLITLAEVPIQAEVDGIILKGRPDVRGEFQDGKRFCIDYKLSDTASGDGSRQICFYSLIVPIDVGWVFYPVLGLMKPVRLGEKRRDQLRAKVQELVARIRSGDREPNHKSCAYCPFLHQCDRAAFGARARWSGGTDVA